MEVPSRVLIACTHFWPSIGGLETIAEFLGNYLVRTGYQVDVATLYRQDRSFNVYRGINIISLDASRKFNDTPLWIIQLRQLVTSGQYGACILMADPLNPIIWSLHRADIPSNTKIIIQPIINKDGYAKWCDNKPFRQKLADILKKSHAVVALTCDGVERHYFKEEGISSILIPNAVDVIVPTTDFRAKFNIAKKAFVILHIANLWPVKNHLGILDALRVIPPDWRLVMIGHPSQDQSYVSQVQESMRRNPQVVYIPGLSREDVAAAFEAADVVILASYGEVSPVTILEAMSHKKPWIATPECGAVHDLAGGVIVPLNDFTKVLSLLANSEYLQKLGSVGYEHWQACYCWSTVILAWDELIRSGSTQKTFSMPESVKQKQKIFQAQIIERLNESTSPETNVTHQSESSRPRLSIIVPTYSRPDIENNIDYRNSLSLNNARFREKWSTVDYEEMLELRGSLVDANAALIAQGQQAFDAGNINQSLELYTKVLNTNPVDEAALCGIGQVYLAMEKADNAIYVYEKVVRINSYIHRHSPMDTALHLLDAYSNLALLYAHSKQIEKAISMLKSAIVLNGADASLYNNLGVLYFKKAAYHDARHCFEKALSIDANYKEAQQNLEKVTKNNNVPKSSENYLSKALEIKVSAIVSVYAAEVFIQGCLEDLTAQSLYKKGELEIVVIDSCSPQNEEKIVQAFQKNYPHIKYFRTDTRETIYQAWNRGIKIASGKYITNANADDRHRQDALELLANHLDENPNVVLVYGNQIITETENETFSDNSPVGVFQWPEFDRNYLLKVCCIGPQPMWRKSVHSEYGFFEETLQIAGDYEFWLRISQKYCFKHIPEYLGLYLISPQSAEYRNRKLTLHETFIVQEKYKNIRDTSETSIVQTPLVSVIIPAYNRPDTLKDAIESIAAQTHKHIEVIVVNDAGEDVSAVINDFKGRLAIKYLVHDTNKDRAAARNTALKHASGQYIAYLDDDDVFYPDHIETALKVLTTTDYKVVYTDACRAYQVKAGNSYQTIKKDVPYSTDYTKGIFYKTNITPILCVVHDKACFEGVGMFDESLPVLEDWDLWIRMAEKYNFYHIKKVTCEFSWREDGTSTTSNRAGEFARIRNLIYERYGKQIQGSYIPASTIQQKLASIIILTWNVLEYTKKCVHSIQNHTSYPHEIIFVDNASTDGTVEYLRNLIKGHSNYKLIENQENRGFAAGNNQGVAAASREYVFLLNNDVLVSDGWLEGLVESLERDEKIGMVGPITNSISGRQMVNSIPYTDDGGFHEFSQKIRKAYYGRLTPRYRIAGFAVLMKKSLYEEVGGLDESFGTGNYEDDDLCLKIREKGYAIMVDESVFIHHYRSQTFIENKIDYRNSLSVNESKFMGKWPDVDYKSLLELDKSLVDINADLISQGQKAIESENTDEAIKVYLKALSTNPIDEAALCGIGMAYQLGGKIDSAVDVYKKVIKTHTYLSRQLSPGGNSYLLDAYHNLALVYADTNQIDDAIFMLKKAVELNNSDASLHNNLGVLYFKKKMYTDARKCFSNALSIDAHYGEAKKNLEKALRM